MEPAVIISRLVIMLNKNFSKHVVLFMFRTYFRKGKGGGVTYLFLMRTSSSSVWIFPIKGIGSGRRKVKKLKRSLTRETLNFSTNADSRTNTI
jgi:hypothetical protein